MGADEKSLRPVGAIGTAVEDKLHVLSNHDAVFLHAGLDLDHRSMARIAGGQFLGIVNDQLDRPAAFLRQGIAKRDVVAVALAAKVAADVTGMNDQARWRNL